MPDKRYPNLVPFTKDDPRINRGSKANFGPTVFRRVSNDWADRFQHYLFNEPESEFFKFLRDGSVTAAERMVSKIVEKIYKTGDPQALNILLDRFLGKQKETIDVKPGSAADHIDKLSDDELEARAKILEHADK